MLALWLPILVSTAVLFFASFVSWMVVRLHEKDWVKIDGEDQLIATVRELNLPEGNYMFPGADSAKEMGTNCLRSRERVIAILESSLMSLGG